MPTRLGNFFLKSIISSPFHALLGDSFAVIRLTGRKTGRSIATPINTVRVDDVLTVISLRERTWWRNLRGDRPAELRRAGKLIRVRGEILEAPMQVRASLIKYFDQFPGYAKYFGIRSDPAGKPDPADLERVSGERVIIRLLPLEST
jgi:hypothetical protein